MRDYISDPLLCSANVQKMYAEDQDPIPGKLADNQQPNDGLDPWAVTFLDNANFDNYQDLELVMRNPHVEIHPQSGHNADDNGNDADG